MTAFAYVGTELELFAQAHNWKAYCRRQLQAYLRGDVAEVGAGKGATTQALTDGSARSWTCIEPDAAFVADLPTLLATCPGPTRYTAKVGTLADLPSSEAFDAVLYMDVLEHIEHDADELRLAASRLRPGGCLIVLSPAHDFLMSEFDRAIGHHRRYDRASLARLTPPETELVCLRYLDAVGVLASLGNRLALRQAAPTAAQIRTWDRLMVPVSRLIDRLLAYRVGKSILAVWRKR